MAASKEPSFASIPITGVAQIATANPNRDGTGTIAVLLTGSTEGAKIEEIVVQATGTTTAGMIRFYYNDGVSTRLIDEVPVTAVTPSGTVTAYFASRVFDNLILTPGHDIRVSTQNAETFNVFAHGGRF